MFSVCNSINNGFNFFKNSSFNSIKNIDDLLNLIKNDKFNFNQFVANKFKIQKLVQNKNENFENINKLLNELMILGLRNDLKLLLEVLSEIFSLEILEKMTKENLKDMYVFNSAPDLATQVFKEDSSGKKVQTIRHKFNSEWKKFRPLALYFIPNLINLFFDAFNFLDVYENYTSLWEKQLIFDILYKFMFIPSALVKILEPILIVPIKIYTVAAAIFFSLGMFASAYERWFKPLPNSIVNCQNMDRQLELGHVKKKVGDTKTMNKVIAALMSGCNVLLVGKSGEGKTGLVHQFVQYKKDGKLDDKFKDLRSFSLNCSLLMGHGTFNHAEMLHQTRKTIKRIEKKILMFFDEVDQITNNPSCFQSFKEAFLNDDQRNPLFIGATTYVGKEKIQNLDKDGSFMQRVEIIEVEPAQDTQCELMINDFLNRNAKLIPKKEGEDGSPEIIKKLLEISKSAEYLPNVGRLAKIKKIMKIALGRCQWAYSNKNISKDLTQAREEYDILLNNPCGTKSRKKIEDVKKLREKIQKLETKAETEKKQIQKINDLMQAKLYFENETSVITKQVLQNGSIKTDTAIKAQKKFYLLHIFDETWMNKVLESEITKVNPECEIQLNSQLIDKIFEELKKTDNNQRKSAT